MKDGVEVAVEGAEDRPVEMGQQRQIGEGPERSPIAVGSIAAGEDAVLACSALKRAYRRYLRVNAEVKLVFLRGEYALIAEQLQRRRGHFMNPALLRSQFADLEEPKATECSIVIELGRGPHKLAQEIKRKLPIRR